MLIFRKISTLALRHAIGVVAGEIGGDHLKRVVGQIQDHLTPHSGKLAAVLANSNEKAWKTIEIALGGGRFLDRFADADQKRLCAQIQGFLASAVSEDDPGYLSLCLKELRQAKEKGHLQPDGGFKPETLAEEVGPFALFDDPEMLLDAECKAVQDVAAEFRRLGYKHLGRLMAVTPSQGAPLLAIAAQFYFREAVSKDAALSAQLQWVKLIAIDRRADEGFAFLTLILERHGEKLDSALRDLAEITTETHDAVLGLREDVQRLFAEHKLAHKELTAGHSFSIKDDGERALFDRVKRRYRALTDDQKKRFPDLLLDLSKLEIVAGDYQDALADARAAASAVPDARTKGEAHHAAFRAALELKQMDEALQELRLAALADSRFAIWDAHKHDVQRILGAGAFGVALLCKYRFLNRLVVVKSFEAAGLDRDVETLFGEAQTLDALNDPGIIKLLTCGFVDPERKQRPYLEIEHFPDSLTLEDYVGANGKLSLDDLREVATLTAKALQSAHKAGVLHRDVKPANLLVRKVGKTWEVKVIDFGLSLRRSLVQNPQARAASQGKSMLGSAVAGTLHYAAPEQLDAGRSNEVGEHSDVHGFGRTCYFALFGDPSPDFDEIMALPDEWRSFLGGCTKKQPATRPKNFEAVLESLARCDSQGLVGSAPRTIGAVDKESPVGSAPRSIGAVNKESPVGSAPRTIGVGDKARSAERTLQGSTKYAWIGTNAGDEKVIRFKDQEIRFRWCPPTSKPFLMGSPKREVGRCRDEDKVEVTLSRGFWMLETPVTQGLWRSVIAVPFPDWSSCCNGPNFPAYNVNHIEAEDFAENLTEALRESNLIPADWELRLPTEAQWEYAARAGTTTRYHFGNDDSKLGEYAWYGKNAGAKTHEVKTRKPNPWGLYDMLGNVWEWCRDNYETLLKGGTDPECDSGTASRVIRGGGWSNRGEFCRSAVRSGDDPVLRRDFVGFRVALVPSTQ